MRATLWRLLGGRSVLSEPRALPCPLPDSCVSHAITLPEASEVPH